MKKLYVRPQPLDGDERRLGRLEGTVQYSETIDGFDRTWEEYVPTDYDPSVAVPLVVEVHGGSTHNAAYMRPMAYLAEREKFIVLFPHCIVEGVTWNVFNELSKEDGMPDDIHYFDVLIEKMFEKYNIDKTRVYIHGQSMGDMMATTYLKKRANIFAAGAPFSGPSGAMHHIDSDGNVIYPEFPLPVVRTHGSEDLSMPCGMAQRPNWELIRNSPPAKVTIPKKFIAPPDSLRQEKMESQQLINIKLWLDRNGCAKLPNVSLRGKYGVFQHPGDPFDFTFFVVEGGGHNPRHEMYDYLWQYFFTGFRRIDGKVVRTEPQKTFVPDSGAVILADGSDKAYVDNKLTDIGAPAKEVDGVIYVPLSFIETAYPGVKTEVFYEGEDGKSALIKSGDNELQISTGARTCLLNQYFRDMERVMQYDGVIYVPIEDVASLLFGKVSSSGRGIHYISDHTGTISYDFAYLIELLLGKRRLLTTSEMYDLEVDQVRRKQEAAK